MLAQPPIAVAAHAHQETTLYLCPRHLLGGWRTITGTEYRQFFYDCVAPYEPVNDSFGRDVGGCPHYDPFRFDNRIFVAVGGWM